MTAKKTDLALKKEASIKIKDEEEKKLKRVASMGFSSITLNSVTASEFSKGTIGDIDLSAAIQVMRNKTDEINNGNLKGLETTLTAQATTLDCIFNSLARRANNSDTMSKLEIYLRLALKAQAQCARTLEVLATMKNPPIVFAKQANISNGNQQVNNGSVRNNKADDTTTHAGKNINQSNELLEHQHHGEWLDNGKKAATSGANKEMATVEALDRG